jgi:transcription initiation factor TFIIIB Brf1 subunit/transcription initiation factor TFIIB
VVAVDDVVKKEISAGKDPMALTATVLYISCLKVGEKISIVKEAKS